MFVQKLSEAHFNRSNQYGFSKESADLRHMQIFIRSIPALLDAAEFQSGNTWNNGVHHLRYWHSRRTARAFRVAW